jgi:hypothetical protein
MQGALLALHPFLLASPNAVEPSLSSFLRIFHLQTIIMIYIVTACEEGSSHAMGLGIVRPFASSTSTLSSSSSSASRSITLSAAAAIRQQRSQRSSAIRLAL